MKKLTRREKERQDRIKYIFNIAEELFSRKGYFKVKMKEIAQKTEFALATLYRFFHSKEALYKKMIFHRFEEMMENVKEEMTAASSNLMKIEKFIEAKLTFLHQHKEFIPIFLNQTSQVHYSDRRTAQQQSISQWCQIIDNLSNIIKKAIAEKKIRSMEPLKLAFVLDHMTNAVSLKWLDSKKSESLKEDIEDIKNLLLTGITNNMLHH